MPWTVEGVRVHADPFAPATPLHARFAKLKIGRPPDITRDFIVISPAVPGASFPLSHRVKLVSVDDVSSAEREFLRFLLPSYPAGETMLLVDDMPSCIPMTYALQAGYFQHHCQALGGSSGA